MYSPYQPTWPEFNPAEFILADFNYSEHSGQKNEKSFKKIAFEIIVSFALFILFAYSLSWVDQKLNQRQKQNQVFDPNPSIQIQENENLYYYFQQGYIGQNLINLEEYKFEIEQRIENLKKIEKLT